MRKFTLQVGDQQHQGAERMENTAHNEHGQIKAASAGAEDKEQANRNERDASKTQRPNIAAIVQAGIGEGGTRQQGQQQAQCPTDDNAVKAQDCAKRAIGIAE